MLDFVIIGAGISGVSFARILQLHGIDNFVVLERESEAGGLCRSREVAGHFLDLGGGHFLCSKFDDVYDFVFDHIPKSDFNYFERVSKIQVQNTQVDYPLESNLWQLPLEQGIDFAISTLTAGELVGAPPPKSYADWIRWKLGECIAQHYMLPYNEKIWGISPENMDIDWLQKIPVLNGREILESLITRKSDRSKFPSHAGFYYPKEGGYQRVFDAIATPVLPHLRLSCEITKIRRFDAHWTINEDFKTRVVINTAPWKNLLPALEVPSEVHAAINALVHNSLVVSLFERQYDHDWHWIYLPDPKVTQHREFFIHNFCPASAEGGLYTESNLGRWQADGGIAARTAEPLLEHINRYAYPVPASGHAAAIARVLDWFAPQDFYGLGRWGQWQYFNSDVCIKQAMTLAQTILGTTLPKPNSR